MKAACRWSRTRRSASCRRRARPPATRPCSSWRAPISPELAKAQRAINRHEDAGTHDDEEYHDALATFDELGGWQLEPKAKRILSGLAFRESDFDREARTMSGGWIMRAHLARLLVMEPDLLLLDEPTNHLDLESLVWFQEYLADYPGAILMISHDREFLNQLVDSHRGDRAPAAQPLPRQLGQIRHRESRARRAAARRVQESAEGNRVAAGVRRSLPRQGQQSLAGAEQAQADRSDGEDRGAAGAAKRPSTCVSRSRRAAARG